MGHGRDENDFAATISQRFADAMYSSGVGAICQVLITTHFAVTHFIRDPTVVNQWTWSGYYDDNHGGVLCVEEDLSCLQCTLTNVPVSINQICVLFINPFAHAWLEHIYQT